MNFNRDFHYKPSILGYPYFWKHPYVGMGNPTQDAGSSPRGHDMFQGSRTKDLPRGEYWQKGRIPSSKIRIMYFQSNLSWFSGFRAFSCTTYGFLKWVGSEITPFFGNSTHLKHQLADYEFQRFLAWYSQIGNRSDPEFAHIVAVERLKVEGSMI